MRKILMTCFAGLCTVSALAQQKAGKVMYQRTVQLQIITDDGAGRTNAPSSRTDRFEMNFANNQMIWKHIEDDLEDDNVSGGSGLVIRTIGAGADDAVFCDFSMGRRVESREFFDKRFIVSDSIRTGNWKLTDETKTILNHSCRKATAQRVGKRMIMNLDNGKMERKEVDDTSNVVAWFTTDIPVPAGPEMQGQLPGLILEMQSNNGRTIYEALEITAKPDLTAIREPTKGKKVTPQEFAIERNKLLAEMEKNNQGGNLRIRVN